VVKSLPSMCKSLNLSPSITTQTYINKFILNNKQNNKCNAYTAKCCHHKTGPESGKPWRIFHGLFSHSLCSTLILAYLWSIVNLFSLDNCLQGALNQIVSRICSQGDFPTWLHNSYLTGWTVSTGSVTPLINCANAVNMAWHQPRNAQSSSKTLIISNEICQSIHYPVS
jgi:hypothetical protein